jgi:uncharacterized protein
LSGPSAGTSPRPGVRKLARIRGLACRLRAATLGAMTSFNVRQLKLVPGQEHRESIEIELPSFSFGGQRYIPVPELVRAELVVTRALTGTLFTLAFGARLHGPCHRCLGDAVLDVPIRSREYQAASPDDEELQTPYLEGDELKLSDWARDAVALALPDKILCAPDCAGLCQVCGDNLNDRPHEHALESLDPRWAVLESLRGEGEVRDSARGATPGPLRLE